MVIQSSFAFSLKDVIIWGWHTLICFPQTNIRLSSSLGLLAQFLSGIFINFHYIENDGVPYLCICDSS